MSVIAVRGVPLHWNLKSTKNILGKTKIKSGLDLLNFDKPHGGLKTLYVRVSEKWDPLHVVQRINALNVKNAKLSAIIPTHVPNLQIALKKGKQMHVRPTGQTFEWKLMETHRELLEELQCKYTRLMDLSNKTGHKLMDEIAETLFRRLKHVMQSNSESTENCFTLSKGYRKAHPHFADFQLILSTLHRLEDAEGAPRTQLSETELIGIDTKNKAVDDVPIKQVQKICAKYENRIIKKVQEYVQGLQVEAAPQLPEAAQRARVRAELKNIAPYLTMIIKQVISTNFIEDTSTCHKMCMYGEPYLPAKDVLVPMMTQRCRASHLVRSRRLFNLLRFSVPLEQFAAAMAMDGFSLNGMTLTVRPSVAAKYKIKPELANEMNNAFQMDTSAPA